MADFTTNLTGVAQLDDNLVALYSRDFIISAADGLTTGVDSLVTKMEDINAKSLQFPVYSKLTVQTSALNSREEVVSQAMADSQVTLTPAEYGNTVTLTSLVQLQTAGVAARGAIALAGINSRESQEKLMLLAADASTNMTFVGQTSEAAVTASDIITPTYINQMYNKLRRAGIPMINGSYWAIAHDDVIHDLRTATAAGTWVDVNKYENSMEVRANEVGMYGGFRWMSHPLSTINADAGASAVDTYHSHFFGFNAFGKGTSLPVGLRLTGPFDKLGRFVNIGWYGVYTYGIVDQNALWTLTSASSIGTNA